MIAQKLLSKLSEYIYPNSEQMQQLLELYTDSSKFIAYAMSPEMIRLQKLQREILELYPPDFDTAFQQEQIKISDLIKTDITPVLAKIQEIIKSLNNAKIEIPSGSPNLQRTLSKLSLSQHGDDSDDENNNIKSDTPTDNCEKSSK